MSSYLIYGWYNLTYKLSRNAVPCGGKRVDTHWILSVLTYINWESVDNLESDVMCEMFLVLFCPISLTFSCVTRAPVLTLTILVSFDNSPPIFPYLVTRTLETCPAADWGSNVTMRGQLTALAQLTIATEVSLTGSGESWPAGLSSGLLTVH